jgi:hypothetical protein
MPNSRVDRIARHLARSQVSRRVALQASGLGAVAALAHRAGTPAAQSTPTTCPGTSATEVAIDGAWLCRQPYALCTTAPCERSTSDPTMASCRCVVLDGYSIGYTT